MSESPANTVLSNNPDEDAILITNLTWMPDLASQPSAELPNVAFTAMPTFFALVGNDRGSFGYDLATGKWSLRWASWHHFETWLRSEQHENSIQFVRKNIRKATPGQGWLQRHELVCARQGSGGLKKHVCKDPDRKRNIPTKRLGCPCRLTVKTYPNTEEVLGMYTNAHSHDLGKDNLKFTRITPETRAWVTHLLSLGVENERIVCKYPNATLLPNMEARSRMCGRDRAQKGWSRAISSSPCVM
jgi:hypothetical protein